MKISEIFESIQGEGRYQGTPVTFIRTSGCTRKCSWCDTKYHTGGITSSKEQLILQLEKLETGTIVVWTGGEPLLYRKELIDIMCATSNLDHHLETNGDLIKTEDDYWKINEFLSYMAVSPKDIITAKRIQKIFDKCVFRGCLGRRDIKVVTDISSVNKSMLKYATMLMPLTTYTDKDMGIRQAVWNYCVRNSLFYSGRLHVEVWKQTRKK